MRSKAQLYDMATQEIDSESYSVKFTSLVLFVTLVHCQTFTVKVDQGNHVSFILLYFPFSCDKKALYIEAEMLFEKHVYERQNCFPYCS